MTTPRPRTREIAWLWLPVGIYMAGIFIVSGMPEPPAPSGVPDTPLHEVAYFGLTLLLIRALSRERWSGVTFTTLTLAWLMAVTYGVTDEWHQSFVPNRTAEVRDLGANAIGAFAAAVVAGAWGIIRRL